MSTRVVSPNLIVVVFDTLRYDAVQEDLAETPHLQAFAAESAVFTNAWGEGMPTIPFRRALYTGMRAYPWRYSVPDRGSYPHLLGWHAIPEAHTTAAEYLTARGYATQLITDNPHMFKPTMNYGRGFISWELIRGQEGDTYELSAASFGDPAAIDAARIAPASYLWQTRNRRSDDDYFAARVFDRAGRFVQEIGDTGPFCLWVECFSPHEPWDPPVRFADRCAGSGAERNYIRPQELNDVEASEADIARTKALYQGYCTFCDERFGRFWEVLRQSGLLDHTVVVVLSDHGTELWEQGRFGKSSRQLHPYNTQINLMIRHPQGSGSGVRVGAFVQNQDVLPTVFGLLDIPCPPLDGHDLWQLVTRETQPRHPLRDHVVTGWDRYASIRDDRWNLIVDTLDPERDMRLHDLRDDPLELKSVAGDRPDAVAQQVRRLEALLGAPLPARYQHRPGAGGEIRGDDLRHLGLTRGNPM